MKNLFLTRRRLHCLENLREGGRQFAPETVAQAEAGAPEKLFPGGPGHPGGDAELFERSDDLLCMRS
jgi:hypothetical protein